MENVDPVLRRIAIPRVVGVHVVPPIICVEYPMITANAKGASISELTKKVGDIIISIPYTFLSKST